jgi:tetratricopeptide (TPR) repeat protein
VECSTRKNTSGTRAYHAFTTRYNILFNAEEAYEEILEQQTESYADNYAGLLPFFPVAPAEEKSQPGGPFDAVVDKASRAIQEHSITAKPRRDPNQAQTDAYRQWLQQEEFNPMLKKAWLLLGKSHLQNNDYEEALAVFSHMQRIYKNEADLISETEIWMLRVYTEMNRMYDAADIAYILRTKVLPKHLNHLFNETYTQYLLRKESYAEAIPWLRKTIETEKSPRQKKRLQFLLGQVYAVVGEKENAYRAFEAVKGLSTPYELTMQATISQLAVASETQQPTVRRALEKMRKKTENENDLEMIQTALERKQTDNPDRTKFTEQKLAMVNSDTSQADSLRKAAELHELLYQKVYQAFLKGESALVASTFEFPSGIGDTKENRNKELIFSTNQSTPHLLLLTFSTRSTDKNRLLFSTANFNFSRFRLHTFDSFSLTLPDAEALCIRPFDSFDDAARYLQMLQSDSLFMESLTGELEPILISEENLLLLQTRGTTKSYREFFTQHYGPVPGKIQPSATASAPESDESMGQKQEKVVSLDTPPVVAPQQQQETIHPQPIAGERRITPESDESMGQKQEKVVSLETLPVVATQQQRETIYPQPVAGERRITPEELQRELERKAADALQQNQERGSGKSRKELLKERERVRQQKIRQREQELKERARRRKEALRQREKEREQNISNQERIKEKK